MATNFLERDLEDIIFDNPEECRKRGLRVIGSKVYRQVRLNQYGVCDLLTIEIFNSRVLVTVYELKHNKIGFNELGQISRYISGIYRILVGFTPSMEKDLIVRGVLIGKQIDDSDNFKYVYNQLDAITIYNYSYKSTGIKFEHFYPDTKIYTNKKYPIHFLKKEILRVKYEKDKNDYDKRFVKVYDIF